MADRKITELAQLTEPTVNAADVAAVADISANETRKITVPDLTQAGIRLMPDRSISGEKLEDDTISANKIEDDAITTDKIANGAVTEPKIANDAVTTEKIRNNQVTSEKIGNNEVTLGKLDPNNYGRGLDRSGSNIGITNNIGAGTFAGITYTDQGLISAVDSDGTGDVPRDDLPLATESDVGVVSVPAAGGLAVSGTGALSINNNIQAAQHTKITYDSKGLVTAGTNLEADDLPIATTTTVGAVQVPSVDGNGDDTALDIDDDGNLTHATSGVDEGTYEKVTVNAYGHVIAGSDLVANDIPDIGADKITSGTLPTVPATPEQTFNHEVVTSAIADQSIGRRHFNDISIAYIQENQPTSNVTAGSDATVFRGCLWLRESTGQLWMFNGNSWNIVAGGQLTQENLRFMGTYDADANVIISLTDEGVAEQLNGAPAFTAGNPVPACDDELSGCYFLIETAGSNINLNSVAGNNFVVGDLLLGISTATGWTQISGAFGGGGGGGNGDALWERTGGGATAELTPANAADNLDLQGGDWLALPFSNGTAVAPSGGHEGSIRWNSGDNQTEIWDSTQWRMILDDQSIIDCGTYPDN